MGNCILIPITLVATAKSANENPGSERKRDPKIKWRKLSLCALRDITGDHKTPRKLKQLSFLRDAHAESPRKGASFLKFALDENDDINVCVDEINKSCYDDPKQNTAAFLLQINRPYPKDYAVLVVQRITCNEGYNGVTMVQLRF